MNTIEFAVEDGVPYAIDFLNPAPDFERDRITPHYFEIAVQKMAELAIDRVQKRLAIYVGPHTARLSLKTFAQKLFASK